MKKSLLVFLCFPILILSACIENKLQLYNDKYYFVNEGAIIQKDKILSPQVLKVSYSPEIDKEKLFLHFITFEKVYMTTLEEFLNLLSGGQIREATKEERINAEFFKEKTRKPESKDYVTVVEGVSIRIGDLADDVYKIFQPRFRKEEPSVIRDINGEIIYVTQHYALDGIKLDLSFKRREQYSNDSCSDCPYRLYSIEMYPYLALSFKDYMKSSDWLTIKE